MRRDVGVEPDPIEYKEKLAQLTRFKRLEKDKSAQLTRFKRLESEGKINLYYLDETGLCLVLSVPYGWQNVGEYLPIKSRRGARLNVLGIMNRNNHLETYISSKSINSDVIIAGIDTFFPKVNKPKVIVVAQSSIHTSDLIIDKIEAWFERGITIFKLPSYSPHLNLIEILWRFIKYKWIDIDADKNW